MCVDGELEFRLFLSVGAKHDQSKTFPIVSAQGACTRRDEETERPQQGTL